MGWTFLTTHGLVLVELAVNPRQTMRSLAEKVVVSERTIQYVIRDLVAEGYVIRTRKGRRNEYSINRSARMRHPAVQQYSVAELLQALA